MWFLSTNSSSSSMLTFSLPMIAMIWCEYYRDSGYDVILTFDDLIKHAKSYRQLALIIGFHAISTILSNQYIQCLFLYPWTISRGCFSLADAGSISCMPILETINSDISEYISTNVISITDGQLFIDRSLFSFIPSTFHRFIIIC